MTSHDPPPPRGFSPEKQQRQAPTIELTATEIPNSAEQKDEPGHVRGEPQRSEERPAETQPDSTAASENAAARMPPPGRYYGASTWIAALAGAAAAACFSLFLAYANPFASRSTDLDVINARLTRLEATASRAASASDQVNQKNFDGLAARVGKLESATVTPQPNPDTAAANRLSTIEGELRALSESIGVLRRRDDEIGTAAREAGQRADAATGAVADLRQKMTPSALDDSRKMQGELQNALARLATMEGGQKKIESELAKHPETRDQSARIALAATALSAAVEGGQPFVPELAAVKSLPVNSALLAPLEPFAPTGVPTPAALGRELTALVPQLLAAGGAAARESTFFEKLQANAEKLVRIRPLEEAQGRDAAAVVTRAENKASKGNLSGAVAELETLPPDVRTSAAPWMNKAQARLAAIEASRRLAADALAGLRQ